MTDPENTARAALGKASRVVIKLGTRVATRADGRIALARLMSIVEAAAGLREQGREVLIVSSGAVGLGKDALGLDAMPENLEERQACAAVGQSRLMNLYQDGFESLGGLAGQVLLTGADFDDRVRYLRLRDTLETLLRLGVTPIINANDAVSTEELAFTGGPAERKTPVFGDNDKLSALLAARLDAELLVLLTDVAGVYESDPRTDPDAQVLQRVDDLEQGGRGAAELSAASGSSVGRGGMRSKVEAATIAARAGCHAVIASGLESGSLAAVLRGETRGTWFPAKDEGLAARRRWIAFAAKEHGTLHLDAGAVTALRERGASLLAAGVARVEGEFDQGDVVALDGPDGERVGRGIVYCDAQSARRWCGGEPPAGVRNHHALVHRNHLVLQ